MLNFVLMQVPDTHTWQVITGTVETPTEEMHIVHTGSFPSCKSIIIAHCRMKRDTARVDVRKYGQYMYADVRVFGPRDSV